MSATFLRSAAERAAHVPSHLPTLPHDVDFETFEKHWRKTHAVLLRRAPAPPSPGRYLDAMRPHAASFADSFTGASVSDCTGKPRVSLAELFADVEPPAGTWYSSWITQRPAALMERVYAAVPLAHPPCIDSDCVQHQAPLWWFVGRNASSCASLPGRPEHTDDVAFFTWHYQCAGAKEWTLRPTSALVASRFGDRPSGAVRVRCEEGDVLLLSTREWWHSTTIPPLDGGLSVSYAREFALSEVAAGEPAQRMHEHAAECDVDCCSDDDDDEPTAAPLIAEAAFAAGAVVLSESEMADVELPVSDEPNCTVAEDPATGDMCIMALTDIAVGEEMTVGMDY